MINSTTKNTLRTLVVPMNWGLGHATRLIPVIRELKNTGTEVLLGGSPLHQKIIQEDIAGLETVELPSLNIRLSGHKTQVFSLTLQLPIFLFQILKEHLALRKLIREKGIDIVISDNCYGLWNRSVYTVFITHQLQIKLPRNIRFFEKTVNRINSFFIRKYNECWVPDMEEAGGFAGELSHTLKKKHNIKYMGILSRFMPEEFNVTEARKNRKKRILFILSGPEKQRTVLETIIRQEIRNISEEYDYTVIRGQLSTTDNDTGLWLAHANSGEMFRLIQEASIVICRAGYSTIMDLLTLKKPAILIPTPGQTEQEYLAKYLSGKGYFYSCKQHLFRVRPVISEFEKQHFIHSSILVNNRIEDYIKTFVKDRLQEKK